MTFDNTSLQASSDKLHWHVEGFGLHRGTVVGWDEDHDERIRILIDNIGLDYPNQLGFASEP